MKKKSLYLAGASLLTAAFGFTALAVSGVLPNPLADEAGETPTLEVVSTYPAQGEGINKEVGLTQLYLDFKTTGDAGVTLSTSEDLEVKVMVPNTSTTSEDPEKVFASYSIASDAVYVDPENKSRVVVNVSDQSFTANNYHVIFPAGAVSGVVDGVTLSNAQVDYNFVIYGTLNVDSTYPANNSSVENFPEITQTYIDFKIAGDNSISLRKVDADVVVTKDDAEFATYKVNSDNVYASRNYTQRVIIDFQKNLEPGVYKVSFPADVVTGIMGGGSDSTGSGEGINVAFEYSFTVNAGWPYTFTPAAGTEMMADQIRTVTLTFEEGTEVGLVADAQKPGLYFVDPSYTTEKDASTLYQLLSEYDVKAEKNVVTFTALDPEGITSFTESVDRKWDCMKIPAGCFTLKHAGGEAVPCPAMEFGKWAIRNFTASGIQFIPALDSADITTADLEEITMILPEGCSWAVANDLRVIANQSTMVTLYPSPLATSISIAYVFKSIEEDGRTIHMVAKKGASNSAMNNFSIVQTGGSTLRINAKKIKTSPEATAGDNAQLNIPAWNIKGIEYDPIYNSSPANGSVATSGVSGISLSILRAAYVVNDNAEITLSKDGKLIKSVKASETVTANAKDAAKGSTSISYANLFKDAEGKAYTEPGIYSFHVPAGTFQQVGSDWTNNEVDVEVYVAKMMDFEASPKPVTVEPTGTTTLNYTVNEEIAELNKVTLTFPDAVKVRLTDNYASALASSAVSNITYANAIKWVNGTTTTFVTGTVSGYTPNIAAKVIGDNQVELTFNPLNIATINNALAAVKIGAGLFIYTVKDADGNETSYANPQFGVMYQPVPVQKPVFENVDLENPVKGELLSSILLQETQSVYNPGEIVAYLLNDAGEKVVTYKANQNSDPTKTTAEDGLTLSNFYCHVTDADKETLQTLPNGNYKFVIEKGTLRVGSATSATTSVFNSEDFVYDIQLRNYAEPTKVAPAVGSTLTSFSYVSLDFTVKKGSDDDVTIGEELTFNDKEAKAVFYKDGEPVKEIGLGSTSLQYGVEGAPFTATFVYDVKGTSVSGEYKLVVPQGMFNTGDGLTNAEFVGTWTVEGPTVYTASPVAGKVEQLETVSLTFPEYTSVEALAQSVTVRYVDPNHDKDANYSAKISCDGNVATLTLPGAKTDAGNYYVEVPAGAFSLVADGVVRKNTAFTVNYNVVEAGTPEISILPAPGEVTVEELMAIRLKAPEGYTFASSRSLNYLAMANFHIRLYEADEYGNVAAGWDNDFQGTYMNSECSGTNMKTFNETPELEFKPRATGYEIQPGKHYVIKLNKGAWLTNAEDGASVTFADVVEYHYTTVEAAPSEFDLADVVSLGMPKTTEISQATMPMGPVMFGWWLEGQGYTLDTTKEWSFAMNGEDIFSFKAVDPYVELYNKKDPFDYSTGEADAEGETSGDSDIDTSACTLLIYLTDMPNAEALATMPGAYSIKVPAGAILKDGVPCKEYVITYNYTVESYSGDDAYEFTPKADTTVADLNTIKITFPDSESVTYAGSGRAYLTCPDGTEVYAAYPESVEGDPGTTSNKSLVWDFSKKVKEWKDGVYTLTIKANTLRINVPFMMEEPEANVPEIKVTWNVDTNSGVTLIGIEAADSYNVFTVDGAAVRLNGSAEDVLNLDKGVYIINGQKVYIRK